MCKTSRSTTTRWTSSTRRTSSRWTSCSSRGTSFANITKSREQQHLSRTCSSHNRCTVSQTGVERGALVGHRQRPVWVWEVVEECSTYRNGQPFKNTKSAIILHSDWVLQKKLTSDSEPNCAQACVRHWGFVSHQRIHLQLCVSNFYFTWPS